MCIRDRSTEKRLTFESCRIYRTRKPGFHTVIMLSSLALTSMGQQASPSWIPGKPLEQVDMAVGIMVGLGDGSSSALYHVKGTREQTKQEAAAVYEVE